MLRCVHVAKEDFYAEGGVRVSNEDAATAVQGMKQSVAAGELWLEPGVAERCAAHCDALVDGIDSQIRGLQPLTSIAGFGGFGSGSGLQNGFRTKARDAMATLTAHSAVAQNMAEAFRAAGAAYAEQEDRTSSALVNAGQGIDSQPAADGGQDR